MPVALKALQADPAARYDSVSSLLDDLRRWLAHYPPRAVGTARLLAVRSFVRHDQLMKQPNVAVAMARALERVHSPLIVDVIRGELGRLYYESPKLAGWERLAVADPDLMAQVEQEAYGHPSGKGSRNPSANPSGKGFPKPFRKGLVN